MKAQKEKIDQSSTEDQPQIYKFIENKIVIRAGNKLCDSPEELLSSPLFYTFLFKTVDHLSDKNSILLDIFPDKKNIQRKDLKTLKQVLIYLTKIKKEEVEKIVEGAGHFLKNKRKFNDFVEFMYNYWRSFDRFIICSSLDSELERRPYRIFNDTIESLTHLVRRIYRDIQENITGQHPVVYRQVRAGAEIAAIASSRYRQSFGKSYAQLNGIRFIHQILLNPPLILNPPMNKRTGSFIRIETNPLDVVNLRKSEWICYPAKVGDLLILVYFHQKFFEIGFSLCNLFELADEDDLMQKPDGIYLFGVPGNSLNRLAEFPTVFYEDTKNQMLVAAVPNRNEFGYFGYLKKMVLTLHNIKIMQRNEFPFHGALIRIACHSIRPATVLIMGDTGAGKSETLEALRILGDSKIQDITIVSDDMGSVRIDKNESIKGYGTEIGAFVRLDDLQPGYAFGQIDRVIIMSPSQINARAILPVSSYEVIMQGHPIDFILYANNYEEIDADHPVIERFSTPAEALRIFREGTVMSKGTTTSTGIVHSYFANIFGPPQYKDLHEKIAQKYFETFFKKRIFVGQIRTRLGIKGCETSGPEVAAKALLKLISGEK